MFMATQNTSILPYSLLPAYEGWRQALIFPTVDIRTDGVSLNKKISTYILWIELASRKVWGLTITTFTPFISFRVLEKIALRLETARHGELDSILTQMAAFAGWRKAATIDLLDIDIIVENLVKAETPNQVVKSWSVIPDEKNIRQAAYSRKAAYVEGLVSFNNNLDTDALKLIGNEPVLSSDDAVSYNYLIHPVAKLESYRRQAIETFPLLRNAFCRRSTDFRTQRLQQNVDSGNPLLPALSDYFHCPMPVVRFLVGKEYSLVGEEWFGQLNQLVDLLSLLKSDFWPHAEEDWQHFHTWMHPVFSAISTIKKHTYSLPLANCLNDLAKEGYARIPVRLQRHGLTLIDVTNVPDFERSFYEWANQMSIKQSEAGEMLWQYSILKVAVLSHRWHDWLIHKADATEDANDERVSCSEWKTFIHKPWKYEQYIVIPLNCTAILQSEGARMHHCVGSYGNKCAYQGSHIYSIRDRATGMSLSTVELSVNEKPGNMDEIFVNQHRGYKNSLPTEACEQTLKAFLRYLKVTVTRDQFREISYQRHKRRELWDGSHSNSAWTSAMIDGFRGLLHGYPLLENLGQNVSGERQ